jgi:hypothetical protein
MLSDRNEKLFDGYLSDMEDDAFVFEEEVDNWYNKSHTPATVIPMPTKDTAQPVTECSAVKQCKLDIPIQEQRETAKRCALEACIEALKDIKRVISSKTHNFEAGRNGLQAHRAQAIQSCLHAMVHQNMGAIEASQAAAVGAMMARGWGGHQVRWWMHTWVKKRELPQLKRGTHAKTYSLVSDPIVQAEL